MPNNFQTTIMSNDNLLGTIRLTFGSNNMKQIKEKLPKPNYGGMRRNSSMPSCIIRPSSEQKIFKEKSSE